MSGQPKCILVGLAAREDFATTPALDLAISLARKNGAFLTVYALAPAFKQPPSTTSGSASAWVEMETEFLTSLTSSTARAACKIITHAGIECMVEAPASPFDSRTGRFVKLARVNDLALLDAADAADTTQRTVIEDALFESGRPVLVVPELESVLVPRRVAIAWDGSGRSARAVNDALPLLRAADAIFVVTVTGEKDLSQMAPGAGLSIYLTRHGVSDCKLATLSAMDGDVASRLRTFMDEEAIDMLVMGAFVHSRFREAILGGVTRSLLDTAHVPLFMAH